MSNERIFRKITKQFDINFKGKEELLIVNKLFTNDKNI